MNFIDTNTGYKIGNFLKKTTDGGYNWFNSDSIMTNNIKSYTFINPDTGWCIGTGGRVIRTNDGGNSWSQQNSNTSELLNSITFVSKYTGYITGSNGLILKTITGGLTEVSNSEIQFPERYSLHQNYPNPFNPSTKISYALPKDGKVSIKIFDIAGKEVMSLVNEVKTAGYYSVSFNASNVSSGIYFYRLKTGDYTATKKMMLVK